MTEWSSSSILTRASPPSRPPACPSGSTPTAARRCTAWGAAGERFFDKLSSFFYVRENHKIVTKYVFFAFFLIILIICLDSLALSAPIPVFSIVPPQNQFQKQLENLSKKRSDSNARARNSLCFIWFLWFFICFFVLYVFWFYIWFLLFFYMVFLFL